MPKVLLYITARFTWIFIFFGTDFYENRAHVHVGKRGFDKYCKIWLEPEGNVAENGELTQEQIKQGLRIANENKDKLIAQGNNFKEGKPIRIITIKK